LTITGTTDEQGSLATSQQYDSWGNSKNQKGSTPQYGYQGREPDNTGLIYYRARYYQPQTGRFTQADPKGFIDGINKYAYAVNSPVNFGDPYGTSVLATARKAIATQASSYFITAYNNTLNALPNPVSNSIQSFARGTQGTIDSQPSISNFLGNHIRERGAIVLDQVAPKIPGTDIRFAFGLGIGKSFTKSGRSVFNGMEVRAQRSLSHIDSSTLKAMQKNGFSAKDSKGNKLILHHHKQNPSGPIIEIPAKNHSIGNPRQQPNGNTKGGGLSMQQRNNFNLWKKDYWKGRATQELGNRGL